MTPYYEETTIRVFITHYTIPPYGVAALENISDFESCDSKRDSK